MHEETIIVEFEADRAKRALPRLLKTAADRRHAHELLEAMETHFKLDPKQLALVGELRAALPIGVRGSAVEPPRARAKRRVKGSRKAAAKRAPSQAPQSQR
jgi:hypothetical protein